MNTRNRTRSLTAALAGTLLTLALAGTASAQISVTDTYLPAAELTRDDAPGGQPAEMAMNILDVGAEVPVFVRRQPGNLTLVSAGLSVRRHSFDLRINDGSDDFFPSAMYAIDGSLAVMKSLSERWSVVGFGSAGLHSDLENVSADHLVMEGGGFLVRRFGDNLQLGLGPVLTYAFGKPVLIPAPFVRYQGAGKLSIETHFPRFVKAGYAVTRGIEIAAVGRSLYNNYRIGDERAMDGNGDAPVIVFSDLTVGAEAAFQLRGPVWLTIGAGTTLRRTMTVNDDSGNQLFDRGMKNGPVFSAGLVTR